MRRTRRLLLVFALLTAPAYGAFPTTPVLDNFNRANENPLSNAGSWGGSVFVSIGGQCNTFKLVSNQIQDDSAADGCGFAPGQNWWETTFGPGIEAYFTIPTLWTAAGSDGWVWLAGNGEGTAALRGYLCYFTYSTSWSYACERFDNESTSTLVIPETVGPALSSGDSFGAELTASGTLTMYRKPAAGSWAPISGVPTVVDTTYTTGHIGLSKGVEDTTSFVDDFGGGTITVSTVVPRRTLMGVGQ